MPLTVKPNFERHVGRILPLTCLRFVIKIRCSVKSTESHSRTLLGLGQGALPDLAWGLPSLGEGSCQPSLRCGAGQTGQVISKMSVRNTCEVSQPHILHLWVVSLENSKGGYSPCPLCLPPGFSSLGHVASAQEDGVPG